MKDFLGVLGGMGPLATADFLRKLAQESAATCDQEHIPILLYGDCSTPDRTDNIIGAGLSPLPKLLEGVRFLSDAGARAICIPCNSAHHWFDEVEAESSVTVLHIARASVACVSKKNPSARRVGVMSTLGTHRTGIYARALSEIGYEVLAPREQEFADFVSPGIAFVKANIIDKAEIAFEAAAQRLLDRGADIIILGCTEIPIGMQRQCALVPSLYIDSTNALAQAVIEYFSNRSTQES
ncbi:MAG: aspartate/glutamate racemase family protein [Burkholderiales bacterium]|jgi:aspartate racemase|nr:aspartate/glutamate racemase family protein [Burkholderiales bacterium]